LRSVTLEGLCAMAVSSRGNSGADAAFARRRRHTNCALRDPSRNAGRLQGPGVS
jgi:hypothetical protein